MDYINEIRYELIKMNRNLEELNDILNNIYNSMKTS